MPQAPPVTDVFEHVEPDPDAILEQYGVDSPDELVATAGRHDPGSDDAIDADETEMAAFANDLEWEFVGEPETVVVRNDEIDTAASAIDRTQSRPASPSASNSSGDRGSAIETRNRRSTRADGRDRRSSPLVLRSSTDLELVGPDPATRRIDDDTFGRDGFVFGYARLEE